MQHPRLSNKITIATFCTLQNRPIKVETLSNPIDRRSIDGRNFLLEQRALEPNLVYKLHEYVKRLVFAAPCHVMARMTAEETQSVKRRQK